MNFKTFIEKYRTQLKSYQLERREKYILMTGGVILFLFIVLQFIVDPYLNSRKKLQNSIHHYQNELVTIGELREQYLQLDQNRNTILSRIKKRSSNFSLFTFLEDKSKKAGVKKQVKFMKPSHTETDSNLDEHLVEMKLVDIQLKQLVNFLQLVESEKDVVFIKKISIQGDDKTPGIIDVTMQIITFSESK